VPQYIETNVDKFVFRVATDRLYSDDGIWALSEGNRVRVGLTDFVQQRAGDAAFVHLKPIGTSLAAGDEIAELETIKVTLSLLAPVSGTIAEINSSLDLSPETINQDPYGKGWLAVIEVADWDAARAGLFTPEVYSKVIRAQAEREMAG
jgi:glycine cleavage system H protein